MLFITYNATAKGGSRIKLKLTEDKTSRFTGTELLVGVGKVSEITARKWVLIARQVIALAKQNKIKELAIDLHDFKMSAEALAINMEMANYEFTKYKTKSEDKNEVEKIYIENASKKDIEDIKHGQLIGDEVNASRTLANTPAGDMTPLRLAEAARKASRGVRHLKVTILGEAEMKKLKMGAILGVSKGSSEEAQFVIMEYWGNPSRPPQRGGEKSTPPWGESEGVIVLVGKGITFDSGGLNLKPTDYINDMHLDMSGGAAVIHAIVAAAKLGIKRNIVALVPAVENMPSGSSYRPGDVLVSMSGKTIEIGNTDAEGRVVLADALTYAERYNPALVVDVATLTGAAEVALGQRASAIFSKDEKLVKQFIEIGEKAGDYVWPLPLWDEYEEDIKGNFGDWSNSGKTKWGGAITGAMFLYQFAKKYPWVHMDIAPRMISIEGEYLAKGSAGAPVRLLVKLLLEF